jgi:hypothetical protein
MADEFAALKDPWTWKGLPQGQVCKVLKRYDSGRLADIEVSKPGLTYIIERVDTGCLLDLVMPHG